MSNRKTKKRISTFQKFVNDQILTAVEELEYLEDSQRVHLQKLVFTNLVDRFDTLIDDLLILNGRTDPLLEQALKQLDQPIFERDLIRLLMNSENLDTVFDKKISDGLRNSVMRQRHSKKIKYLCDTLIPDEDLKTPRVNPLDGTISDSKKVYDKTIPHGILGYSDFTYSRRNSLVHGAGTSNFLSNDKVQIEKIYKTKVKAGFRVTYKAVPAIAEFYTSFTNILKSNA